MLSSALRVKGVTKEATSAKRNPASPGKPLIHSLCSPHARMQAGHWRERRLIWVKREEQMGCGWYKEILIELNREEMFLLIII